MSVYRYLQCLECRFTDEIARFPAHGSGRVMCPACTSLRLATTTTNSPPKTHAMPTYLNAEQLNDLARYCRCANAGVIAPEAPRHAEDILALIAEVRTRRKACETEAILDLVKAAPVPKFPDIIDTWILDGEPAPWSVKVRVLGIASIGPVQAKEFGRVIAGGTARDTVNLPYFTIALHGGQSFCVGREDSATRLPGKDKIVDGWSGVFRGGQSQPPDSLTTRMTEAFRRELIAGWQAAIAAK